METTQQEGAAAPNADPGSWFDGRSRVMFVHAHPDDETITTGGTLAGLAEAGREPLLVTLTRGERGEVVAGPFAHLAGTDALAPHRQTELAAALAMLGLERHAFLGVEPARAEGYPPVIYEDSGMAWGPDGRAGAAPDASADALTSAPAVEALNDLLAAAYQAGAQAIVSYDDGGGYGHPDHVLAHRLARAVAQALGLPFWEILGDEAAERALAETGAADPSAAEPGVAEPGAADPGVADSGAADPGVADSGAADPSIDAASDQAAASAPAIEVHDVTAWLPRKVAALRAHGTQLTVDGDDIVHVGGQREPIGDRETFRRIPAPPGHGG
ncbi:PIG-L family deacetylase [Leucobacter sp. CSA2]|uniref:PIG-L family deacetylase n=1 Tax=Leucobacter edaphi TaxID=2796472 RepID=A0A934UXT4_9MICO|nr:PIG-L family deacetylase [Leucobacter edaphi]MBK0421971.1 PIG-L family deacetylase [Leucobacter edaphi]